MRTRVQLLIVAAVLLQTSMAAVAQPPPQAVRPALLSTGAAIASPTARVAPSLASDDNGPAALLAEIVASVQTLLLRTRHLLAEALAHCLRFVTLASPFSDVMRVALARSAVP